MFACIFAATYLRHIEVTRIMPDSAAAAAGSRKGDPIV
jgi:hypothetical protein